PMGAAGTKAACDATSAVRATTTVAIASDPDTPKARSRCAFTGSPPTVAVGVKPFTASPAMRTRYSDRTGTRSRMAAGITLRQPKVSASSTTASGTRIAGAIQPSRRKQSATWRRSLLAMKAPSRATPSATEAAVRHRPGTRARVPGGVLVMQPSAPRLAIGALEHFHRPQRAGAAGERLAAVQHA